MVDLAQANVHILTHAMHYASSVFEANAATKRQDFQSRETLSERLRKSQSTSILNPYSSMKSRPRNTNMSSAERLDRRYVSSAVVNWRGARTLIWVFRVGRRNPVRLAFRPVGEWCGQLLWQRPRFQGASSTSPMENAPSPGDDPRTPKCGWVCYYDLPPLQTRGRGQGLF